MAVLPCTSASILYTSWNGIYETALIQVCTHVVRLHEKWMALGYLVHKRSWEVRPPKAR